MHVCLLCLVEKFSTSSQEYIDVYSEEGKRLDIANIIYKHLSLSLIENPQKVQLVCCSCLKILSDFHNLYKFVYETQSALQVTKPYLLDDDDDPLPHEVFPEVSKTAAAPLIEITTNENDFFCPEIKIEEHELDQLPKIEVIENVAGEIVEESRPQRATRRIRQSRSIKGETNTNDIYVENDGKDEEKSESGHTERKTRRGRPRKVRKENAAPQKCYKSDEDNGEKMEDAFDSDSCDLNFSAAELEDAATDDDSQAVVSSDDTNTDSDNSERYAVIPKRVVVRPKKYKKRPKPLIPPVRLSREELERRKAQQEEYDEIIAKFFNNKFACPICNLLVQNFADMLRHHRLTHKVDPGYMNCCGRKFTQRKALAEHVLVHWDPEHFKCKICSKIFHNSRLLEMHEQAHTNPEGTKDKVVFQCDKCPKTFTNKSTFEYHNLSKHVPKSEFKFTCPQCNKKLLTERKLKNHLKSMHDPENAIICDKCGKQMRTKHSLKKHQELMHSDAPRPEPVLMQCQICGTWLKNQSGLKQHMKSIHIESAGVHRCHICNKVSPNARALRRHIYHNHECERKFKCTMCEKAFKRPQELREHTSTHTGEVLYTCPNCPMTFFCSANMYKHRQRLHREQYEADKNQPRPPNILQQAVGATAAMKVKMMQGVAAPALPDVDSDVKYF